MSAASGRVVRISADTGARSRASSAARGSTWMFSALLLGALVIAIATSAHAALYKWTDDHGAVHYSDKLPAEAVNRESYELSRQGIKVKKTEPMRVVVQRAAKTEK